MTSSMHSPIPVLKVRNCYLVTLTTELSDVEAIDLQDRIMNRLWTDPADAVIIDISALEIVDSFISRVFNDIGNSARSMGAFAVIVGMNPAVAITLVEMDIEMSKVLITMDVDSALDMVDGLVKKKAARGRKNAAVGGSAGKIGIGGITAAQKLSKKKSMLAGPRGPAPVNRLKTDQRTAAAMEAIKKVDRGSIQRVHIKKAKG